MNLFLYFVIISSSFNRNKSDDISIITKEKSHFQNKKENYSNSLRHSRKSKRKNIESSVKAPLNRFNDMEFEFMFALKQILIDTFCVLNNVLNILGKGGIDPRVFYDAITIGQFKSKLDLIAYEFLNHNLILPGCNKTLELKFVKHAYLIIQNMNNHLDVEIAVNQLYKSLKDVDIKELFVILLSSIEETEPEESANEFFGLITFVLLAYPVNSYIEFHKILIIHLITMFKMLNIAKFKNIKIRKIHIHVIRVKINEIMCNWISPGNFKARHLQLVEFMADVVKFKSWFNMFPVIFLLKERNSFYPKAFDSMYRSLNSKATMNVIETDYLKCMKMMFSIESFLLNKTEINK